MSRFEFDLVVDDVGIADFDFHRTRWHLLEPCPLFELVEKDGRLPSGWVLVEGRLLRHGDSCAAELLLFGEDDLVPDMTLSLPVLPNGRIHEIIRLPSGVRRLGWRPMASAGWFEQPYLLMRRLGFAERWWRMVNRVGDTLISQPQSICQFYGLTLWRAIVDLPTAYQAATNFRLHSHRLNYAEWINRFGTLSSVEQRRIDLAILRLEAAPHFRLWISVQSSRQDLNLTLSSLVNQRYRNFSVTVFDFCDAAAAFDPDCDFSSLGVGGRFVHRYHIASVIENENRLFADRQNDNELIMLIRAGDVLPAHALYWFAKEACDHCDADMVYADDDVLDQEGMRSSPRFKPDWSPEHLRSTGYIGDAVCVRTRIVAKAGGVSEGCLYFANDDLLLRVAEIQRGKVVHIPAILLHQSVRNFDAAHDEHLLAARLAHLQRSGVTAAVEQTLPGCFRVNYGLNGTTPMLSIIIPTRDGLHLLKRCVDSVLEKSTYRNFELIIVDNGSSEAATLNYLSGFQEGSKVRVIRDDGPFNFSALNNRAAKEASGEVLCLLNNDTEVISPDWMEEMLSRLSQVGIGVVGAKLYFPDGRVQHAGDAVGPGGCADHMHGILDPGDPGYCNRAMLAQEVSAVTGACLMTPKWLYEQIGGLDEVKLKVAFNDVDYCLKVQAAGYRVIFTPYAELFHYESASRGRDDSAKKLRKTRREADQMRKRWKARMRHDPYYNPNLNYRRPDFSLSDNPRVVKPWL